MHWNFFGTKFAWSDCDEAGSGLSLEPDWHEPIPYMLQADPEFEVEHVILLAATPLTISFSIGEQKIRELSPSSKGGIVRGGVSV